MAAPKKSPGPSVTLIKTEPGTSRNPSLRLPSFKAQRDMMLGGLGPSQEARSASRKIYVPNLNVQRKKNEGDQPSNKSERQSGPGRGRDRGKGGRGRGDRSNNKAYIQTATGLFADGITPLEGRFKRSSGGGGHGGGGGGSSGGVSHKRHSIIKTEGKLLDKSLNEERLSALLQDDFIDDPDSMANCDNGPTQLPLLKIKSDRVLKKETPIKVDLDDVETNGEVKEEKPAISSALPVFERQEIFTMSQLINSPREQLVLLKLPTTLPQFNTTEEVARPSTSKTSDEPVEETVNPTPERRELPEGRVGKLQLLKSGRVRLILGDQVLYTQLGLHTQLKQDLIYVDVDPNTPGGNMVNLGSINARIISTLSVNPSHS